MYWKEALATLKPGTRVMLTNNGVSSNSLEWDFGNIATEPSGYIMPEVKIRLADGTEITEYVAFLTVLPGGKQAQ